MRGLHSNSRCSVLRRLMTLLAVAIGGLLAWPALSLGQVPSQAWLSPGSVLRQGQSIPSDSGQFVLWMQGDGNLVLYGPAGPMFATNTVGKGCQLEMQYDGNAVVYDRAHKPVWNSHTQGNEGAALIVQDDGNLVIYTADLATPLWASGTNVPPPTQPTARPGWMMPGDVLYANQSLASESEEFVLWMQDDGNLVLYGPEGPLFATGTNGRGVQVEMQYDGNVVVYDSSHQPVWATGTQGNEGAVMVVQDDGNLVVYAANFATPLWASRDEAGAPPPPGSPGGPADGGGNPEECQTEAVQVLELGPIEATVRTSGTVPATLFELPVSPVSCAVASGRVVSSGAIVSVVAVSDTYAQLGAPHNGWILRTRLEGSNLPSPPTACETGDFPSTDVFPEAQQGALISENVPVYTFEAGPGCEKISEANKFDVVDVFGESAGFYHIQRVDGPGIDLWVSKSDVGLFETPSVSSTSLRILGTCLSLDVGPATGEVCGVPGGNIETVGLSPSLSLSVGGGLLLSNGTPRQVEGLAVCGSLSAEALVGFKGAVCSSVDDSFQTTGIDTAYGGISFGIGGGAGVGIASSTFVPTQDIVYLRCEPQSSTANCPEGFRSDAPGVESFIADIAGKGLWAPYIRDAAATDLDYATGLRSGCYALLRSRNLDQREGAWREDQFFLNLCVDTARPF